MTLSVPGRVATYAAASKAGKTAASLKGPKSRKKKSKKKK